MLARARRARSDRGIVSRPIKSHQCPRLLESRFGSFQILIGNVDLLFESVQLRVLKNFPPLALRNLIAGLRCLPVRWDFLVSGWRGRSGLGVTGSNCAGAEAASSSEGRNVASDLRPQASDVRPQPSAKAPASRKLRSEVRGPTPEVRFPHCAPCGVWAMRTASPSTTESGGLTITFSFPSKPATTSTSLPKS